MFQVNREVMAIESHPCGEFKKGDIYVLKGISVSKCCGHILLDIGKTNPHQHTLCSSCNKIYKSEKTYWFSSKRFAPIDDVEIEELTEIIENEYA